MKKLFLSLVILLTLGSPQTFAQKSTNVNFKITNSFDKEFPSGELLSWHEAGELQMATFIFHSHLLIAYFNDDGDLLGYARDVLPDDLPIQIAKALDERFANAAVVTAHEVFNTEGSSYWITLDVRNKRYHAQLNSAGNFLQVETIKQPLVKKDDESNAAVSNAGFGKK